jgi:preprotein translocase subunit SecG
MQTFVTVIHVLTCILLVLVVLIQSGKGAEISTSFGGSSQTVFGSSGGANFFTRFTSTAAAIFMVTSVVLTLMSGQNRKSVFEGSSSSTAARSTAPANSGRGTQPAQQDQKHAPIQGTESKATENK